MLVAIFDSLVNHSSIVVRIAFIKESHSPIRPLVRDAWAVSKNNLSCYSELSRVGIVI